MAAVLEKHLGLHLADHDIYVNVAGGIRITEVGVELPIALALYSARVTAPLPAHLAVIGEVSLTGEVRPVPGLEKRFRACRERGFERLVGPGGPDSEPPQGSSFTGVQLVREAVRSVFGGEGRPSGP